MNLRLPHAALVLVCDGRKALLLRNEGDEKFPNLRVEQVNEAPPNERSAEQGTDRPGRIQNEAGPTSAVAGTDWHAVAETRFAERTIQAVEDRWRHQPAKALVLVAPPRTLAVLRAHLGPEQRAALLAEIDKDLTKHPVYEIERLLTRAAA